MCAGDGYVAGNLKVFLLKQIGAPNALLLFCNGEYGPVSRGVVRAKSVRSLSLESAAGGSQTSLLRQSTYNTCRKRAAGEMLGLPRSGYSRSAEAVGEISPPTQQHTRKEEKAC